MITRRKFIGGMLGAGLGGPVLLKLWANETPFPDACRVLSIKIPAPAGWAGKTALFVTDIHYGYFFGPTETALLNKIVVNHRPDMVLMGGDLAQAPTTDLAAFSPHWAPGCPTLFSPGNHDITENFSSSILPQAREAGLTVLCNQAETWNDITFIGLPSALRAKQKLSLLENPGLKIILGHEPDVWDSYTQSDLIHLAGHTHGGQIRLLGSPPYLPTLGKKYPQGQFFGDSNRSLIVSAGIGCTDVPVRISCPPEIIKLEFI
ncbi:MAG TPA: metallophosphoesterase [Opitutaceae bacterium]|jgi:predicted MPP superfamily phosphohydrolase|nr:metallophosphoesterase [Opitutaceae bacterium]